jgi:hypothetical protein
LGNGGRIRWVSGRPGAAAAYAGTDFIIARDGRIAPFISFLTRIDVTTLPADTPTFRARPHQSEIIAENTIRAANDLVSHFEPFAPPQSLHCSNRY